MLSESLAAIWSGMRGPDRPIADKISEYEDRLATLREQQKEGVQYVY